MKFEITVDGRPVEVSEGATILGVLRDAGVDTPTLCYGDNLTPVNACRVCMVEVEGSRPLVPACSRAAEPGMVVSTASGRVRHSRRTVLEFLGSSVDLSVAPDVSRWFEEYGADVERFGPVGATVAQPVKVQDDLYVRDYAKCILCYRCVEACGPDAQNTFAIQVSGQFNFEMRQSVLTNVLHQRMRQTITGFFPWPNVTRNQRIVQPDRVAHGDRRGRPRQQQIRRLITAQ